MMNMASVVSFVMSPVLTFKFREPNDKLNLCAVISRSELATRELLNGAGRGEDAEKINVWIGRWK